jgi:hypothetical protein
MHNVRMTSDKTLRPVEAKPVSRWSQDRRLEFIDFRLRWDGRLNRSDLMAFFGISVPQASMDIARYTELAPYNLVYDRSARVYVAAEHFSPLYPSSSPSRFLNELLAIESGVVEAEASFVGWRPPIALMPVPGRAFHAATLAVLLKAVREHSSLSVLYQSMSSPKTGPEWRTLSPHAFAHDGFRWHVRAYCHKHNDFRDFVIARMLEVRPADAKGPTPEEDVKWQTQVRLVLGPNPRLTKGQQRAIELDYGMSDGEAILECRQALLFYLLAHLGLDKERTDAPEKQQVVLKNRKAIEKYL